jgi:hypothetical protein
MADLLFLGGAALVGRRVLGQWLTYSDVRARSAAGACPRRAAARRALRGAPGARMHCSCRPAAPRRRVRCRAAAQASAGLIPPRPPPPPPALALPPQSTLTPSGSHPPNPPAEAEFFDAVGAALEQHAAHGQRPGGGGAAMGAGAARSGQGHLWAAWGRLSPKERAAFLEEMLKVGLLEAGWGGHAA